MDGDILFDEALKKQWASLSASGYSTEQIEQSKIRKKHKDDVWMYTYMVQQHAWESDLSLDRVNVHLKLALALDAICRRTDAIGMLLEAIEDHPFDSRIVIALAKLFFRDDQKDLSLLYCQQIYNAHELKQLEGSFISVDDALNAYYLAGWIKIHDDNHTEAYQIWSEGSKAFPSCPVLLKQQRKRNCWDQEPSHLLEWIEQIHGLLGEKKDKIIDAEMDLEAFAVPLSLREPSLSLFCDYSQQRKLVFRSREELMTARECASVLKIVYQHHEKYCGGEWGTVRKSSVKTTDVAVEDIPALRPWLLTLLHTHLYPLISAAFPLLADGSTLIEPKTSNSRLRVHDAFIVRYDAVKDKSLSLPEHCDTSSMSVIFALNQEGGDYEGGGTWFEKLGPKGLVVNADIGHAVMFAGPMKHAGFPIWSGVRHVLVLFLYVEDYHYGPYLRKPNPNPNPNKEKVDFGTDNVQDLLVNVDRSEEEESERVEKKKGKERPSGAAPGGFVVYRQTVELVSMLEGTAGSS